MTLDLPERVARRYRGRGIDFDDLVQVGRLALVKAAQGYRTGCGHGFVAYAMPTISGEVKRHFRDCGWAVRPPRRLQEVRAELAVEEARLTQRLQRDPTMAELADTLGVESSEITRARECGAAYWTVSLDLPADHQGSQVELVADESSDIERLLRRRLRLPGAGEPDRPRAGHRADAFCRRADPVRDRGGSRREPDAGVAAVDLDPRPPAAGHDGRGLRGVRRRARL